MAFPALKGTGIGTDRVLLALSWTSGDFRASHYSLYVVRFIGVGSHDLSGLADLLYFSWNFSGFTCENAWMSRRWYMRNCMEAKCGDGNKWLLQA